MRTTLSSVYEKNASLGNVRSNESNNPNSTAIANANANTNTASSNGVSTSATDNSNNSGASLQSYYNSNTGTDLPQSQSSEYDDALAQLARQGNYEAYYKKATQLANINRLAQRNLNNTLKQQGLESTGEGTLGSTSLSNAYLNAQSNALSDFNSEEQSITEEAYNRNETKKSNQYSEWSTMLQNAANNGNVEDTLNQILETNPDLDQETINKLQTLATAYSNANSESSSKVSTYQSYMSAALNSGNLDNWYTNNVVNNSELSDTEKSELAKYYEAINTTTDTSTIKTSDGTVSIDDYASKNGITGISSYGNADKLMKGITVTNNDGVNSTAATYLTHEVNTMFSDRSNYTEPTIFQLVNDDYGGGNSGITAWVLYDPYSGKFYQIDANMANGDLKKYAAYRIEGRGSAQQTRSAS